MRRKKSKLTLIDEKRFFSRWKNYKTDNIVTYKRLSDDEVSLGQIKWFEAAPSGRIIVTLVDSLLENFQACFLEDIIDKPDAETAKRLRKKRDKLTA